MDLSEDQQRACDNLVAAIRKGQRVMVLKGPAGSGKTTLVKHFLSLVKADFGLKSVLLASTGKASSRLSQTTGMEVGTVHRALFKRTIETKKGAPVFLEPQAPCDPGSIVVVDESSMVDQELAETLEKNMPKESFLLYVGDEAQLEPVSGAFGPDFSNATASLSMVHRQALDQPIYRIANDLREGRAMPRGVVSDGVFERHPMSFGEVADWFIKNTGMGKDAIVLCWTNESRQRINKLIRKRLGHSDAICKQDRLLVLYNNRRLSRNNGEVLTVTSVVSFPKTNPDLPRGMNQDEMDSFKVTFSDGKSALIHPDLIGADLKHFKRLTRRLSLTEPWHWLHVDYGFGLTFHKSQGSEWNSVLMVVDDATRGLYKRDPDSARRLAYTGVTRAKQTLLVADIR